MIRISQKLTKNKLVLGFAGASVAAVVGAAGLAAAAPGNPDPGNGNGTPAAVAFCKDNWQALGYKNQGQCVAAYQRSQGHGYGQGGSNNTVVTTINNNVSGNNNFIETTINNIFH